MALTPFKDLPDTSTPINAAALNAIQTAVTSNTTAIAKKADKTYVDTELGKKANSSSLTKAGVGLGNVDNTADTAKPVSTAQKAALNLKIDLPATANEGDILKYVGGKWVAAAPA